MGFDSTKTALASLTVWGAVASLVNAFLPHVFVILGANPDVAAQYVVGVIAFVVTVYGRYKASKQITIPVVAPTPSVKK